jgi:hypothetical protein
VRFRIRETGVRRPSVPRVRALIGAGICLLACRTAAGAQEPAPRPASSPLVLEKAEPRFAFIRGGGGLAVRDSGGTFRVVLDPFGRRAALVPWGDAAASHVAAYRSHARRTAWAELAQAAATTTIALMLVSRDSPAIERLVSRANPDVIRPLVLTVGVGSLVYLSIEREASERALQRAVEVHNAALR